MQTNVIRHIDTLTSSLARAQTVISTLHFCLLKQWNFFYRYVVLSVLKTSNLQPYHLRDFEVCAEMILKCGVLWNVASSGGVVDSRSFEKMKVFELKVGEAVKKYQKAIFPKIRSPLKAELSVTP
jgi:hypothetical protein